MKPLLLTLLFAPLALASAQTAVLNTYAPPKDPTILASTFVDWDSLTPNPTPVGQVRQVFDNPTRTLDKLEIHVTTLNPGMESHPVHRHSWEEILLVKEGDFEVSINGAKHHAGPGSLVFFAANDPHNATNVGLEPATYYVINFVTDLSHDESAKSAAERAVPGKLASIVIDCNALPQTATPTGSRVSVLSSPTLTFQTLESHITTLNAGQSTAADMIDHNDEFVLIKSGSLEVKVNGVSARMNAGSVLFWAADDKRSLRNIGATPASYQVIRVTTAKSPKPPAN
ncbi:MAG: cupin domain-containing protein [Acidobacteriaceae bacterium]|jgi:quercetin dioxygenase-like cupin family protein